MSIAFEHNIGHLRVEMVHFWTLRMVAQKHLSVTAAKPVDNDAAGSEHGHVGTEDVDNLQRTLGSAGDAHIYAIVEKQTVEEHGHIAAVSCAAQHVGHFVGE